MKATGRQKKPINPALAWLVILGVIVLAVLLYVTVGKQAGGTGYQMTAAEKEAAAKAMKKMEAEGAPAPAMRQPGQPQPFSSPAERAKAGGGMPGAAAPSGQ